MILLRKRIDLILAKKIFQINIFKTKWLLTCGNPFIMCEDKTFVYIEVLSTYSICFLSL